MPPEALSIGAFPRVSRETGERELVSLAQAGDKSAFEALYRAHAGRVYALCLRLAGDAAEAEDLTQETFIRAWRKLSTFESRSRLSSWLHRLAVNVVVNKLRLKARPAPAAPAPEGRFSAEPALAPSPLENGVDLERAVSTLPEGARFVFVLFDVYGYRHEEISRMTGIAVGTSKAQLHRARRLLREVLGR